MEIPGQDSPRQENLVIRTILDLVTKCHMQFFRYSRVNFKFQQPDEMEFKMAEESSSRRWERGCKEDDKTGPTRLTTRFWILSSKSRQEAGAPAQIWQQYSIQGRMVDLYKCKIASGVRNLLDLNKDPTFFEVALAMDTI